MKKYLPILTRCPLFEDLKEEDLSAMLGCLGATVISTAIFYVIISGRHISWHKKWKFNLYKVF